jgi:hypothetical protein
MCVVSHKAGRMCTEHSQSGRVIVSGIWGTIGQLTYLALTIRGRDGGGKPS